MFSFFFLFKALKFSYLIYINFRKNNKKLEFSIIFLMNNNILYIYNIYFLKMYYNKCVKFFHNLRFFQFLK